jgi:hypothetical protein
MSVEFFVQLGEDAQVLYGHFLSVGALENDEIS